MIERISENDASTLAEVRKDFPDAWNLEMLKSSFNTGRFFGYKAVEDGNTVGFITYTVVDDVDIETVYVATEYRRKGIAENLLDLALEEIKKLGKKSVLLEVREDNVPAIKLYYKKGFNQISVRKRYYGDKDAIILRKEL